MIEDIELIKTCVVAFLVLVGAICVVAAPMADHHACKPEVKP